MSSVPTTSPSTVPTTSQAESGRWPAHLPAGQNTSPMLASLTVTGDVSQTPDPAVLLAECQKGVLAIHAALAQLDAAGTHLTQTLIAGMQDTPYHNVGDVMKSSLEGVFTSGASSSSAATLKEMKDLLCQMQGTSPNLHAYGHTLCQVSLLMAKLNKQRLNLCSVKMAELVHALLCLGSEGQTKGKQEDVHRSGQDQATVGREVTRLILGMGLADGLDTPGAASTKTTRPANSSLPSTPWGSPKTRKGQDAGLKASQGRSGGAGGFRILSLFERKSPPKDERKSMFYVDVEDTTSSLDTDFPGRKERMRKLPVPPSSIPTVSVTAGSQEEGINICSPSVEDERSLKAASDSGGTRKPPIPKITACGTSQLATEEELESVINLLSGIGPHPIGASGGGTSHMQVIPEVVIPQGPTQLNVPQMFRMPSPLSDTQLEELRTQKSQQVHRRSEGCLDLSAMGRATGWPQQHHHRASLPSVQVFSASGSQFQPQYQVPLHQYHHHQQHSGFDTPSPVPSFIRDSPSPSYAVSNPPSPSFFQREPPLSPLFRSSSAGGGDQSHAGQGHGQYLRVGSHQQQHLQRSNVLSPLQWLAPPASPHMGGSLASLNLSQGSSVGAMDSASAHNLGGTASPGWPPYLTPSGVGTSLSPGLCSTGDASSWTGAHDCSDLSDDSSTEDQFFAVGKDLSHMIGSKDGSSDDDDQERQPGRAKSCSTWPPPRPHHRPPPIRLPSSDLLEPPDIFRQHQQSQHQQLHHHHHQQQPQHHPHFQQQQHQHQHPPIHMQWSDPLSAASSSAPSSMWPPPTPQAPPSSPLASSPQPPPLQQGELFACFEVIVPTTTEIRPSLLKVDREY
ncbi:hypothetical protein PoB_003776200 [Plakobranchus ocellatus]|uniref:Uncharacterized protein n=1 Tax=Plakobranchus ocellatus TaxID=259542 RepID=A0AAV4AVC5_9GAST|nr:hypothetical protein PoB_003776200 [Plakobranchus ocellatus]